MLIERTPNGIVVRENANATDFVRVGVTKTYFMVSGINYPVHGQKRPHDEYTVGELGKLFDEMMAMARIRK